MVNNFQKLKKRILTDAVIKASLLGAAAGIIAGSAFALIQKLLMKSPCVLFAMLISVGAAAVFGGVFLLLVFPTDKRMAKNADARLVLNEKIQTMVEFSEDGSDMAGLQRADADARLEKVSLSSLKIKPLWMYIIPFVLAVAFMVTAIVIPKREPPPQDDPDFEMDSWQETSLKNLIQYVKDSAMVEPLKDSTVDLLEGLLDELENVEKVSAMKSSVISAIVEIDELTDGENSYLTIRSKLDATGDDTVKLFASGVGRLGSSALPDALDGFKEKLAYATFVSVANEFCDKTNTALLASGYNDSDMLYAAIEDLLTRLEAMAGSYTEYSESTFDTALDASLATAASEINAALRQQKTNSNVAEYTILKLIEIFEIPLDEIPDLGDSGIPGDDGDSNGGSDDDDEDRPATDGGLGSGDAVYGSDDAIFDPDNNRYVPYGEILNEYYAKISDLLISGTLTDEQIEHINEYFATLYDGSKKQ